MGAALDLQGRAEEAEEFWRLAAFGGPFANYCATLAGAELVARHGPGRGGTPEEPAKVDAEAAAKFAAKRAEKAAANEAAVKEGGREADEKTEGPPGDDLSL